MISDSKYWSFYHADLNGEPESGDITQPAGTEMTVELLNELINRHEQNWVPRYKRLKAAYETKYPIFNTQAYNPKADYKPDNRLAADFAKYIQDTFEGYYIGNPPTIKHADDAQNAWLRDYYRRNNQEDIDADLSDIASEFGKAVELLYQDSEGLPRSVALSPMSAFVVYDDTVDKQPMWGIRYYYDDEGVMQGSYCDAQNVYHFTGETGLEIVSQEPHYFGGVPMIEFLQGRDQKAVFEGVLNLIDAYNKALSEKANDVDYFADAYLLIAGTELQDEEFKKNLREYRLINIWSDEHTVDAEFLTKPSGDVTQENLINRLEDLIYKLAMVPDISDASFGTASGIALKMRLIPMSNLARKKDRKFVASMRDRFHLLANYPNQPFDDWMGVEITMNRNEVIDIADEANTAAALAGIVSEETQLSVLSFVDDPAAEIERKQSEQQERATMLTTPMRASFEESTTEQNQEE